VMIVTRSVLLLRLQPSRCEREHSIGGSVRLRW
jgi:hypothetical protein